MDEAISQVDPQWNTNNDANLAHLRDYHACLVRSIKSAAPRTNNVAKAVSLEEEKHESPLSLIREALQKHGGDGS